VTNKILNVLLATKGNQHTAKTTSFAYTDVE